MNEAEPYARLAAVYDEIVVDPCHRVWASYLHEMWGSDPAQVHSVLAHPSRLEIRGEYRTGDDTGGLDHFVLKAGPNSYRQ